MAVARATPSSGSVPVPTSSRRTRAGAIRCSAIPAMLVMRAEKVLRRSERQREERVPGPLEAHVARGGRPRRPGAQLPPQSSLGGQDVERADPRAQAAHLREAPSQEVAVLLQEPLDLGRLPIAEG